MRTLLLKFENSLTIEAVLHARDDVMLNITELSGGNYPFETSKIICNERNVKHGCGEYINFRTTADRERAKRLSHRVFSNGTFSDVNKTIFVETNEILRCSIKDFQNEWKSGQDRIVPQAKGG